jgi:hypothetical protein
MVRITQEEYLQPLLLQTLEVVVVEAQVQPQLKLVMLVALDLLLFVGPQLNHLPLPQLETLR